MVCYFQTGLAVILPPSSFSSSPLLLLLLLHLTPLTLTMSWQAYVDSNLVGTGKLIKAAIHGECLGGGGGTGVVSAPVTD